MSNARPVMQVGINAGPLLTPLTGIGQYTHHLVRELRTLLEPSPWLFYAREWSRELRLPTTTPEAAALRQKVGRIVPFANKASRLLQQRRFTAGARAHGITLYHEPNYLAFDFPGPSVVTVHDLSWIRFPETHPAERVKQMNDAMPRVMKSASQIIVDSEFVRREVIEFYAMPAARVTTVPLGVTPGFEPLASESCRTVLDAHGLQFGKFILAVGTLEPRKNLATVFSAFSMLAPAERRRFPLVVVGMKGWGTEQVPDGLRSMIDAGEVRMAGYVAQQDLPALYSGARLFVYPSLYEGFGLPPLEAMASGVPVIASNRASLPELVGNAGVLVEALDEVELHVRMKAILEDDELRTMHSSAGILQAAKFSWHRCALETAEVYRRAIRDN